MKRTDTLRPAPRPGAAAPGPTVLAFGLVSSVEAVAAPARAASCTPLEASPDAGAARGCADEPGSGDREERAPSGCGAMDVRWRTREPVCRA